MPRPTIREGPSGCSIARHRLPSSRRAGYRAYSAGSSAGDMKRSISSGCTASRGGGHGHLAPSLPSRMATLQGLFKGSGSILVAPCSPASHPPWRRSANRAIARPPSSSRSRLTTRQNGRRTVLPHKGDNRARARPFPVISGQVGPVLWMGCQVGSPDSPRPR